jgi:ribosome-binding factor A
VFTSKSRDRVTVFISCFPDEKIHAALAFLERQRQEFSDHLKKSTRIRPLPRVEFMQDDGEKNRQRIDEISGTL